MNASLLCGIFFLALPFSKDSRAQASQELQLLTPGLRDILQAGGAEDVMYRGRSVQMHNDPEPRPHKFDEVIGRIRLDPRGLHVTEASQGGDQAGLSFPTLTESFGCFLTGTTTSSRLLHGNPRPEVMIREWQSMPQAWWLMIGRVPPMPLTTYLSSEEQEPESGLVKATYSDPVALTIEVRFHRERASLREVIYRHPDGRKTSQATLIGELDSNTPDLVTHPQAVVLQDYDEQGRIRSAKCWIRVEGQGFSEAELIVPVGALVNAYAGSSMLRERTTGDLPLREVASWFRTAHKGVESPPQLVASTMAPVVIRSESAGHWGELLLLGGGCALMSLGVFLRLRS